MKIYCYNIYLFFRMLPFFYIFFTLWLRSLLSVWADSFFQTSQPCYCLVSLCFSTCWQCLLIDNRVISNCPTCLSAIRHAGALQESLQHTITPPAPPHRCFHSDCPLVSAATEVSKEDTKSRTAQCLLSHQSHMLPPVE